MPFVGFEGGCRHIRFFLAKVFGEPVADGVRLQWIAACDFADAAQMLPDLGFRRTGGTRITDRLEENLAILHAMGPVGSHSLQSHLFRIVWAWRRASLTSDILVFKLTCINVPSCSGTRN